MGGGGGVVDFHVEGQRMLAVLLRGVKGKVCIRARWPIRPALNSGFCNMKRLGILLLPPGWDASPLQGYPPVL